MNRSESVRVVSYGSLTMDLVSRLPRLGGAGDVVAASELRLRPGGGGFGQAVAASRAGAATAMIGRVGTDHFGSQLLAALRQDEINTDGVSHSVHIPTGTRQIAVTDTDDRSVIVHPGANAAQDGPSSLQREIIDRALVLLLQTAIPMPAVFAAAGAARRRGRRVILSGQPMQAIPAELLALVDILVVGEPQARAMTPQAPTTEQSVRELARRVPTVLVSLGSWGCAWASRTGEVAFTAGPPIDDAVVDPAVAGDTFVGYLAAALADGRELPDSIELALAAAAECLRLHHRSPARTPWLDQVLCRQAERQVRGSLRIRSGRTTRSSPRAGRGQPLR